MGFVSNAAAPSEGKVDINKAVHVAANILPNSHAKNFITKLVKEENFQDLQSGAQTLKDLAVHVGYFARIRMPVSHYSQEDFIL